ncbi:unnamed protein product [Rotaria sordida]|uniref:Uncharacterized protein n=1 Tax=Rotaria sordida TaxID=392033 RepID=A0A815YVC5_9BILA|nr:unnamed protein product [Rotaria sordida]CAF1576709.1 unnamed protein product [Rotaria sordida]
MKTCSFRGAEPRSKIEGLFCGRDELQARYTLTPCGNLFCLCCHSLNSHKKIQKWSVVDFNSNSTHRFVNGYTTYLNCPATCTTSNVVYAMTCPCGHYDYVDSTAKTLADAMAYHREHRNRIVHEKLTDSPLCQESSLDPNEKENEIANCMRLYQHSARCPIALRLFLDCNPSYWCFIPLSCGEQATENIVDLRETFDTNSESVPVIANVVVNNPRVTQYRVRVPLPPATYVFSDRQLQQQRSFFERLLSFSTHQFPYVKYQMIVRLYYDTLFIIHAETKLNMICPIGGDVEQRYGRPYDLVWCANLNHSSM